MSLREGLGESARKGGLDGKKKPFAGSRAYQRFFEDYEEVYEPGKGHKIRRVYVGDYYQREGSALAWGLTKLGHLALFLLSFASFVWAAYPATVLNRCLPVALVQALCLAVYFRLAIALCSYLACPRRMTISSYKRGPRPLPKSSLALSLCLDACLLVSVGAGILLRAGKEAFLLSLFYLPAAFLALGMKGLEERSGYQVTPAREGEGGRDDGNLLRTEAL